MTRYTITALILFSGFLATAATPADAPAAPAFSVVDPALFSPLGAISSAAADYNNDGRLDVAVSFPRGIVRLYRNDAGGKFTDVSDQMGLDLISRGGDADEIEVRSIAWADYDGDGYVDLFVGTRFAGKGAAPASSRVYLFHNEQGKGFEDVAKKVGLTFSDVNVRGVSWIDYDNDGKPDLYVANRGSKNHMFHNEGGRFTEVTDALGLTEARKSVGVCSFDMDKTGHLAVFLANQDGDTDAFYVADANGKYSDLAPKLGMNAPGRTPDQGSVGCAVGDYDNDGNLDLVVATYNGVLLYHNNGDGTFTEVHHAAGLDVRGITVGASWGDYDNDGLLDLYIASPSRGTPDSHLFKNMGNGHFVEVPIKNTAINAGDHGVQWVDFDADGALDLSLTIESGKHSILHNDLPMPQRSNSLEVAVVDAKGHYTRAGSEVRLYNRAGKLLGTRLVPTGDGYDSQGTQPVHFGLGEAKAPLTVEVTFLTKSGRVAQKVENIRPQNYAGKMLVLTEKP